MRKVRRVILFAVVAGLVMAAGCGQTQLDRDRAQARERWELSRAEMAVRLAEGCLRRGEIGRAREHVEQAIRSGAAHPPLYVLAARLAAEKGELDRAGEYARTALALAPDSADGHYVIGTIEHALGHTSAALEHFRKAAELDPKAPPFALAEAELLVAAGQAEQAADRLGEAARRTPGRAEIHAARADVLCLLGRYEEAAAGYRTALRLDPNRKELQQHLATALFFAGAFAEAEPILADLARTEPAFATGWARQMRGDCLLVLGRVDEARKLFEELHREDPTALEPILALAKCSIMQDRGREAERQIEKVLRNEPGHAEANALMGYVLMAAGRPTEAAWHLRLALEDPNFSGRETAEALLDLAAAATPVP